MAATIDQTITNRTKETLSTPGGQEERMPSRLNTPNTPTYLNNLENTPKRVKLSKQKKANSPI